MTPGIKSLCAVSVCVFVILMSSMAAVYGNDTAKLDPVDYIKPIIGTNGTKRCGRTIPGPYVPFGMVQLSPDTRTGRGSTNGYNYREDTIEGFSVNHMSGVGWHGTLGNFQIMLTIGEIKFHSGSNEYDVYQDKRRGWKSQYSHDHETAEAGYYRVLLETYGILTELTCTQRTGMLRFTFPASDSSRIQIDLARKIGGYSGSQHNVVVDNGTIKGMIRCWGEGVGFARGTYYNLYYYARFSRPWDSYGLWNRGKDLGATPDVEDNDLGFYANYTTKAGEQITMKVGISHVSMAGAQANLEKELDHWDFDAVKKQARQTWHNEITDVLSTKGGTEDQKTIFYTALYHTMMYPCDFTDVDGRYWGADKKVHGGKDYNHSNEPVHQIISYFNFAGQPWRTQYWTRTVLDGAYGTDHEGLAHNDDFGQFSAWYVLNAMGVNPVAPGENVWHIGSPVFNEIKIQLDRQYHLRTKSNTFTIIAENNASKNIYIQSAMLNGKPLDRPWMTTRWWHNG